MMAILPRSVPLALLAISTVLSCQARADETDTIRCRNGAVVCVSREASQVGLAVLERGGTAVDAAVATAFALAVTYPAAGNIGGGGFLLLVPGGEKPQGTAIDFRETAPAAASREMFVDKAARTPHRRVGVPGTVRGLELAHKRFGRRPWRELVLPAVQLARQGHPVDAAVARELNKLLADADASQFATLHSTFARSDGQSWRVGDRLVQLDLAEVLERIADLGADGFYLGKTAELIEAEMRRGGGLVTMADLAGYRPVVRPALVSTYRGHEIFSTPLPSSGGTTLALALNILETFDVPAHPRYSSRTLHLLIECMKRAYRDRAAYLGDPDTTTFPDKLLDKQYARALAITIDLRRATPSATLAGEIPISLESEQTTHISIVDQDRTAVSLTYTLESAFGSRVVVTGGGFLLNDEMNDFNWLPGVTNAKGRIGTAPNEIAPGKRMLSSMCPIVVRREGKTLLVTGSPGGRTIINTVLGIVVNVVDYQMDAREAVDSPRLHHQWLPDEVRIEPALLEDHADAIRELGMLGHAFANKPARQGDAHTIWVDPQTGEIHAVADRRISGSAAGY